MGIIVNLKFKVEMKIIIVRLEIIVSKAARTIVKPFSAMKIKNEIILILLASILTNCSFINKNTEEKQQVTEQIENNNQELYFKDLIEIDDIENVFIRNNYGEINLNKSQLDMFRNEMADMKLHWCCPTKPGAIYIEITINGKIYSGYSSNGSSLLFFDRDLPIKKKDFEYDGSEIYFEMPKGMNLDNYK